MGVGPGMWNTRDIPPLPELIGCVDQASTTNSDTMPLSTVSRPRPLCKSRRRTLQDTADAREQTLWPRTQTLAAVLLLIGRSQRLKKTETPKRNHQRSTAWTRPSPGGASVCNLSEGEERFGVRGLSPTFSRRRTVSQRHGARGSVASGELRSFLSD